MHPLTGKTAILTGGSRGIGLAIAYALTAEGVKLAILGRTSPESIPCHFIRCDMAQLDAIPDAVASAVTKLGHVDFLINNAGVFLEKPITEIKTAEWEATLRVNLTAPFVVTREILKHMQERRSGRIVNIVSTSGLQGYLYQAAYCASKHGLIGLARTLALEAKPYGIHVYNICPGGVDTEFFKGTYLGERLRGQPLIKPEDIAGTVVFLLSQPDNVDIPEIIIRRFVPG